MRSSTYLIFWNASWQPFNYFAWFPSSRNLRSVRTVRSVRSVKTVRCHTTYGTDVTDGTDDTDGTDGTVFCRAVTTERWKPFSVIAVAKHWWYGLQYRPTQSNILKQNMSRKQATNAYNPRIQTNRWLYKFKRAKIGLSTAISYIKSSLSSPNRRGRHAVCTAPSKSCLFTRPTLKSPQRWLVVGYGM